MRVALVALLFALTTLAGCAESPVITESDETSFEDVKVETTDTTGVILGIAVDESIVPVEGATIKLGTASEGAPTQTTDAQGRFVFNNVEPGTYFLTATHPLHFEAQFSATVEAGDPEPPVVKVQLQRKFVGDPYINQIHNEGYFTCTQAGGIVWGYSSSPCHSFTRNGISHDGCEDGTICTEQTRDFHADVANGWQTQQWEMTWTPSAYGTSQNMGIVVSTYKPERNTNHFYANVGGGSPLFLRIDCCEHHPTNQEGSGPEGPIPPEGMKDMSYFMSVRQDTWPVPALALEQSFDVFLTQAHYLPLPEGWSVLKGDQPPF